MSLFVRKGGIIVKKEYLEPEFEIEKISFDSIILSDSNPVYEDPGNSDGDSSGPGSNPDGEWDDV